MNRTAQSHVLGAVPGIGPVASVFQKIGPIAGGIGGALMGPFGPILGSLASTALNFGLNRIETGIQNRYNSPRSTMQRLAQAGMPGAAYFSGGGNQSASSSQQYANPDLGVSEAISREQVNRMQKQQFELMKREMALKEAQQRLAEANAYKSEVWGDYFGRTPGSNFTLSNFGQMIETQNKLRNAQTFLTQNKGLFQQMDNAIFEELKNEGVQVAKEKEGLKILQERVPLMKAQEAVMSQQVQESISRIAKNMVSMEAMQKQMSVAEQTIRIRQLTEEATQAFLKQIQNSPSGFSGIKGGILSLLIPKL